MSPCANLGEERPVVSVVLDAVFVEAADGLGHVGAQVRDVWTQVTPAHHEQDLKA